MYRPLSVVLALATVIVTLSACSTPTSPSAPPPVPSVPAPAPPPEPPTYYTLSGVVSEETPTGQAPVEGVQVYCDSCGSPDGHTFVVTGADGFYTLSWARNGIHPLLVMKPGYDVKGSTRNYPDGTGTRNATVNGDTLFDIHVARR